MTGQEVIGHIVLVTYGTSKVQVTNDSKATVSVERWYGNLSKCCNSLSSKPFKMTIWKAAPAYASPPKYGTRIGPAFQSKVPPKRHPLKNATRLLLG